MRLLLDTHVFLWLLTSPHRLGSVLPRVQESTTDLLVSAAVAWEIAIKTSLGRLPLPGVAADWVPAMVTRIGAVPLAVEHEHALAVADLPLLHRDPFDRILVCQSRLLRVPIVTADAAITQYDVDVLPVG